jgi:uncharacterized protein
MKIAIFSDSHDNIAALEQALAQANAAGAELLLHCGDLCAPFMLERMGAGFSGPIHVVFGNNDGDGRLLQTIAQKHSQIHLHGVYIELAFNSGTNNVAVALIHYPEPAYRIAQSGQFNLVAYGHNHMKKIEIVENSVDKSSLLVNPGELLGMRGLPTWALYDSTSGECSLQEVAI